MPIKVRDGGAWVEVSGGGGGGGSSDPVGTIVAWAGSVATIPSEEYQLCDGGAASTSELQAITGSNVPDLRDRFVVGAGNNYAVDATGGSANAVVVSHDHEVSDLGHFHSTESNNSTGGNYSGGGNSSNLGPYYGKNTGLKTTGITINNRGVSGTNANLPPYYALCYIIKHTATSGGGGGSGSVVPAGSVFYFASSSTPTGYLKANGAELNKTAYAVLFNGIGTTYGETNGAGGAGTSHFRVPDLRGEFVRGWDNGAGVDAGRTLGSSQTDAFQGHRHSIRASVPANTANAGAVDAGTSLEFRSDLVTDPTTDGTNGTPRTSSETRPRNVALLACIKY
jgi:microcystin-dependent protein